MRNRPSWEATFLSEAMLASCRSPDEETQHGCVIVDPTTKTIVGKGFNGFPRGMNDCHLPCTRPDKYFLMRHSETNAIANAERKPKNCIAFITGYPCNNCLLSLYENGIKQVLYGNLWKPTNNVYHSDELEKWRTKFIQQVRWNFVLKILSDEIVDEAIQILEERASYFRQMKAKVGEAQYEQR